MFSQRELRSAIRKHAVESAAKRGFRRATVDNLPNKTRLTAEANRDDQASNGDVLATGTVVTQLFYNFLELSEGEAYTFRACAVNAVGAGPYAQTPPVETREKLIPPGIRLQEEMTVRAGETINIAAGITGKPVPAISWERGGKPLMAVDRVSLVNDASSSNLDIRKCMRKIDQGVYQVTAKNKVGTASKQIKVTILDVPGEPNDVKISRVFANEMTVTWSKPYQDGGSPITNYVVDRRDVHMVTWTQVSASIDPKKMVIVAHKLLEGVEYVFRVRAENNIGVGPPAESKPTLARSPYGPPGPPEAPEITASGRNWLNIVWQKPKDDGGAPGSELVVNVPVYENAENKDIATNILIKQLEEVAKGRPCLDPAQLPAYRPINICPKYHLGTVPPPPSTLLIDRTELEAVDVMIDKAGGRLVMLCKLKRAQLPLSDLLQSICETSIGILCSGIAARTDQYPDCKVGESAEEGTSNR
ncbi:Titin-like [Branchiostoma belcheri]|nr:Titin-like [Branchiostoma belcheri]